MGCSAFQRFKRGSALQGKEGENSKLITRDSGPSRRGWFTACPLLGNGSDGDGGRYLDFGFNFGMLNSHLKRFDFD